ncbi:hydrogenase expression/formation protein [Magnetospirillum molischianum]|uniref:Hydrogenase expression/formation protein hupH n=1 Tax=Magnetospirillum molischianum DSM 120 TaxID=1150626 RepID=H8FMT2_MAGML|nr:hydrogenase expression/formation protein [Magnetospirillum molischianum]CCG39670.1 hydrogenase expression/formation protein hupH [Magnetospirillum molischianum DSM 120]
MILDLLGESGDKRAPSLSFLSGSGAEEAVARCPRVAALLPRLAEALTARSAGQSDHRFDLAGLDELELTLIADVLGEGEVSGVVTMPDGIVAHIEEAVMAGLWRVRCVDSEGRIVADYLDVAAIPEAVRGAATVLTRPDIALAALPAGLVTASVLVAEIGAHLESWRPGQPNRVVTVSHLPVPLEDMTFLQELLGTGPVRILSRGYASCRVVSTATRHVWSVQYVDAAGAIVLDTLEIGDVPAAACATEEDIRDSALRVAQIDRAYFA